MKTKSRPIKVKLGPDARVAYGLSPWVAQRKIPPVAVMIDELQYLGEIMEGLTKYLGEIMEGLTISIERTGKSEDLLDCPRDTVKYALRQTSSSISRLKAVERVLAGVRKAQKKVRGRA